MRRSRAPKLDLIEGRTILPYVLAGGLALALALVVAAVEAHAAERVPIAVLKDRRIMANAACDRREALDKQLESRGQCFAYIRNRTGGRDPVWRPCWPLKSAE